MKAVFMGTPEGAAYLLGELAASVHNVSAAVTRPDKPKGRGLRVQPSPVAAKAQELGIHILKPVSVSEKGFLDELRSIGPDVIIVAAFGRILPPELLDIPKYGCINVHLSLLPKYRGASPVQSALLGGEDITGVTIMRMNEKLDEGDVLEQASTGIGDDENAGTLTARLFSLGARVLLKVLDDIMAGRAVRTPQDDSNATYCRTVKKSDGLLDISADAGQIINSIRAYTPWPGAHFKTKDRMIKVISAREHAGEGGVPGLVMQVIKGSGIVVSAGKGCLLLKEIQPENSRRMTGEEFANGYRIKPGQNLF